uniref:Uncharacterized protein n=1 Tax=Tetraselmis sp. GSL018 TaxID=582737 RepID=A0A061S5L2_9CHLO
MVVELSCCCLLPVWRCISMDPVAAAPRHCPSCNDCCHVRRTDRTQALGRRPSVPGAAEAAEPPEIRTGRNIRSSDEILASWVRILPLVYCSPRSHQLSDLSCPIFVAASFPFGDASQWNVWQPLLETVPLAMFAAIFNGLNPSPVSGCCPFPYGDASRWNLSSCLTGAAFAERRQSAAAERPVPDAGRIRRGMGNIDRAAGVRARRTKA